MTAFYQIAEYPFCLKVSASTAHDFENDLKRVFFAFRLSQAPCAPLDNHSPYSEQTPFGGLYCTTNGTVHQLEVILNADSETADPLDLVDTFEPLIVNHAIRETSLHLWIHGACLVRDDEVILLVAETGAGKTTLSLGLLAHGYRLLTDDIILINPLMQHIVPVPRCPKYRTTAPENLRAVGFDLERDAETLGHYVLLPDHYLHTQALFQPIRRVIFLQRAVHSPPGPQPLSFSDGLLALLPQSNLLAIDPQFTLAEQLFATTQFTRLNLSHYLHDLAYITASR